MVGQKTEIAEAISYTAATGGFTVGAFLTEHWLQIVSVLFMLLTYLTHLYFAKRKDRREVEIHDHELQRPD